MPLTTSLDFGQLQPPYLGPELGNVVQILRVQAGLLEEPPSGFHRAEILLGFMFPPLLLHQPFLTPYPSYGLDADGEIVVSLDSFRPEGGERLFQLDGLLTLGVGDPFCRMVRRSASI